MDIHQAIAAASHEFDLTEEDSRNQLTELAEKLLGSESLSEEALLGAARSEDAPLQFKLAVKLVCSRLAMRSVPRSLHIGVVFAMWGEGARLQKKSADNPNGEDALRVKLDQLDWVCQGTNVDWTLYAVDDGDPDDSGATASAQASSHRLGHKCQILWLADGLPAATGPLRRLLSVEDSRKGGAVIYGADTAIRDGADAVVYTDADNSVHLGQLGLLVEPYCSGSPVVIGNRKHPDSILVKAADRWGEGIKTLRHIQRMIGHSIFSKGLSDTQAAFKLYDAKLLAEIIQTPTVFDFSLDTDWLAGAITRNVDFHQVPFAFIDSESESASAKQNPMTTWETLLFGLLRSMRRHNLLTSPASEAMAKVVDEEVRDYRDLERLIDVLPVQLREAREDNFGDPELMTPDEMAQWIRACCSAEPLQAKHHSPAGVGSKVGT